MTLLHSVSYGNTFPATMSVYKLCYHKFKKWNQQGMQNKNITNNVRDAHVLV